MIIMNPLHWKELNPKKMKYVLSNLLLSKHELIGEVGGGGGEILGLVHRQVTNGKMCQLNFTLKMGCPALGCSLSARNSGK